MTNKSLDSLGSELKTSDTPNLKPSVEASISSSPASEWLTSLANRMRSQDSDYTVNPLFVVYNERKIYGMDPEFCHDYDWIGEDSGDYTVADARKVKALERYEKTFGQEPSRWTKRYYILVDEFATCAFTREAAEYFIARKARYYERLYIDIDSMCRMPEMVAIEQHLLSFATPVDHT